GPIAKGEVVVLIESEKAEAEVEATQSGVLRHVYVPVGETVPCGTLLAAITDSADEPFDAESFRRENDHPEKSAAAAARATSTPNARSSATIAVAGGAGGGGGGGPPPGAGR